MMYLATNIVYIWLKKKITVKPNTKILLKDIAFLTTSSANKDEIEKLEIYYVTKKDEEYVVIDSFIIVDYLNHLYPDLEFQLIGLTETIITIKEKKNTTPIFLISVVWIILFIGTAMTIMNFHYDVSMQEVQQRIHYLFTGRREEFPLWIQIPYSLGLGVGMILFLNHWFKKRLNEEPSPLEIEIFNYQKDIDNYIAFHENDLNDKN